MVMSINLFTDLPYFLSLSIFDLLELCEDYKELQKEMRKK